MAIAMKKLAYIFTIALFISGCGGNHAIDVSYDPENAPMPLLALPDKHPMLYLTPVEDNRNPAVGCWEPRAWNNDPINLLMKAALDESEKILRNNPKIVACIWNAFGNHYYEVSRHPSELIGEALKLEAQRLGMEITADRDLADGILKASFEKWLVIDLKLYKQGVSKPVWNGKLSNNDKARPLTDTKLLSDVVKQWRNLSGFTQALSYVTNIGRKPNWKSQPAPTKETSKTVESVYSGTGFLFSAKDYVITNWHVVRGTKNIRVKFLNGEKINATVLLKDSENDIAFLKLEQSPQLPASEIRIGDSSKIRMGDEVFAIGYPAHWILGMNPKYTKGEVNALSGISDDPRVFQVSVQIQPGNSGGPLFNSSGEVIGITQASLDPKVAMGTFGTLPQNVNYAIKSSYISSLLPMLPETMIASRGIVVVPADPENNLANFIDKVKKNIVLIEAKE